MGLPLLPPQLIVILISTLPVGELRIGIPVGVALGLSLEESVFWGITGSMLPVLILLKLLGPISNWLMKHSKFLKKLLSHVFEKTRLKHTKKFQEAGALFLLGFVAIPLPGTGAWTGTLLAFLFGLPYWKSTGLILVGVLVDAVIISLGVTAFTQLPGFIQFFLK